MVDLLIELAKDRELYVHLPTARRMGITPFSEGLKLPHTAIDAERWHELVPDGAILVIDEVQDLWRPRGPGRTPPPCITELETHGHRGIDIFLTSQKPRLIDQSVRDQVGRHVHIRNTGWLGRWSYEWPECNESLSWKTCVLKKRFRVPKRTFEVYKSANVHSTPEVGKSRLPLVVGGLVLATVALVVMVVRAVSTKTQPKATATAAKAPPVAQTEAEVPAPRQIGKTAQGPSKRWPVYDATPVKAVALAGGGGDLLAGRALVYEGGYRRGNETTVAYFGLLADGERLVTLTLSQLSAMGYRWTEHAPCVGVLERGGLERLVTCRPRVDQAPARSLEPMAERQPVQAPQSSPLAL